MATEVVIPLALAEISRDDLEYQPASCSHRNLGLWGEAISLSDQDGKTVPSSHRE